METSGEVRSEPFQEKIKYGAGEGGREVDERWEGR